MLQAGGIGPPTYVSVSPSSGVAGAGITVTGTNFITGLTTVTVGGVSATSVSVTNTTTLTCTVPAVSSANGTYDIAITTPSGSVTGTAAFAFYTSPTVTGFSTIPYGGSGGSVTITGTNFTAGSTVTVGGTAATSVVVNNATSITCTFPAKATGSYTVTVTSAGGSGSNTCTYNAPPVYPTVSSVSPSATNTGSVTYYIYGTGFNATGTLAVLVDGSWIASTYATIDSDSQAHFTQAFAAGSHSVAVYNYSGGWSNTLSGAFATYPAPTISLSSDGRSGLGSQAGSTISLTGTNLTGASVTIGGTSVSASVTSTTISFTCPSLTGDGSKTIAVTTAGGTANTSVTYWGTQSPATTSYTTAGSGTYTIPGWANYMDVVVVGAGGGGNGGGGGYTNGGGGGAGTWSGLSFTRSLSATTYSYTVGAGGNGGVSNTAGTAGGASAGNGVAITGAGGAAGAGQGITLDGYGAGNYTLNTVTYTGGAATATGNSTANVSKPGNPPGGGGAGGLGQLAGGTTGGNGAAGAVWFRARQS